MFQKLQKKWKVNGLQLFLVLCVFAIAGTITGYIGKIIMNLIEVHETWLWTVLYVLLVTLVWPFAVILVSIPFGQFSFFRQYLRQMGEKMGLISRVSSSKDNVGNDKQSSAGFSTPENTTYFEVNQNTFDYRVSEKQVFRIAIFASGTGSNAQKIIDHFRDNTRISVSLVVSNKRQAGVLSIAERERIPVLIIEKHKFFNGNGYVDELKSAGIDLIVLAGFLWKIPQTLITAFRNKIINIHPALLPKFGGKGMYGNKVHEAVLSAGEKESGITIHFVDEHYDNGDIIFQERLSVSANETPDSLAQKIHRLEHSNYPRVIEEFALSQMGVKNQ